MNLDDPTTVALFAAEALGRAGIEHALYGGMLLAAYGAARETRDADLAVAGASVADAARSLETGGLHGAIAFERVRFGSLWVSRITLLGGADASGLNTLDLVEPCSIEYARRALTRSLGSTLRSLPIRLLTPEDFVAFKVLSTRELRRTRGRTSHPRGSYGRRRCSSCHPALYRGSARPGLTGAAEHSTPALRDPVVRLFALEGRDLGLDQPAVDLGAEAHQHRPGVVEVQLTGREDLEDDEVFRCEQADGLAAQGRAEGARQRAAGVFDAAGLH